MVSLHPFIALELAMTTITIKSSFNPSMQGLSKTQIAHAVAELAFNDAMFKRITSAKVFVSATTVSVSYEIGPKPEVAPEPEPEPEPDDYPPF